MLKLIISTLLLKTILFARVVSESEQNGVMVEGVLFVIVFGTMGIISYIYSSRHAKAYKKPEVADKKVAVDAAVLDRISELSKMLENGNLTEKEFELLKNYHLKR